MKVWEWPPQSPDISIIENLWRDLKHAEHARRPENISELEVFCQDEWGKFQKQELKAGYRKRLQAVIVARGGVTALTERAPKLLHRSFFSF